jgi:hypothetical protein
MAKIAHESKSVTVFSIPITDVKVRQITSAIEAEIVSAGIRVIKVEGVFDANDRGDKNHHILEKTQTDFFKTVSFKDDWEPSHELHRPLIFSLRIDEDEDGTGIVSQWNSVYIEFHWVTENEWETDSGGFLDYWPSWLDVNEETPDEIVEEADRKVSNWKIRSSSWFDDDYLYPLLLASRNRPPSDFTEQYPCAVFLIDAHEILEEFSSLQAKISHYFHFTLHTAWARRFKITE